MTASTAKLSKQDQFTLWFTKKYDSRDAETEQVRKDLKKEKPHLLSKKEEQKAIEECERRQVNLFMRGLPEQDELGETVDRVHVIQQDDDGKRKDVYVQRNFLTYEQAKQAIEFRLTRIATDRGQAVKIYEAFLKGASKKDAEKLRDDFKNNRLFQRLLNGEVGDMAIEQDD